MSGADRLDRGDGRRRGAGDRGSETGLRIIWGIEIPLLPIVFFVAPGLWRNICPDGRLRGRPVAIVNGIPNLSAVTEDERATVERLDLAENTRLACCCRIRGR